MNINQLPGLSVIAAGTAPIAPASVVGLNVHHEVSALLVGWGMAGDIIPWLAIPVALGAAISLELTGAAICKTALEAWRERLKTHAVIAAVGAAAYTGMVVWSILAVQSSRIFYPFALLSLLAYVGLAISNDVKQSKAERSQMYQDDLRRGEQRIREIEAQRLLQKAEAERVRAETKRAMSEVGKILSEVGKNRAQAAQPWQDTSKSLRERVKLYDEANPGKTDREAAQEIGCGKSTVSEYRKEQK